MRCCSLLISPQTHMSFGRPHVGQISGIFLNQHINLAEYLKVIVSCSASMKEQKRGYCVSLFFSVMKLLLGLTLLGGLRRRNLSHCQGSFQLH
jgi:hypothetical protein